MKIFNVTNNFVKSFQNYNTKPYRTNNINFTSNTQCHDEFISSHEKFVRYTPPMKILHMYNEGKNFGKIFRDNPQFSNIVNFVKNSVIVSSLYLDGNDIHTILQATNLRKDVVLSIIDRLNLEIAYFAISHGIGPRAISEITGMSEKQVSSRMNSDRAKLEPYRKSIQEQIRSNKETISTISNKYGVSRGSFSKIYNQWLYSDLLNAAIIRYKNNMNI